LRQHRHTLTTNHCVRFPFLLGRAFIEATESSAPLLRVRRKFPFLFGRTFIEALSLSAPLKGSFYFPSYVEGLSWRQ